MIKHIILDILLLLVIIICPWWGSVIFALFLLYYLKSFNEIILFGLVIDIYYSHFSLSFNIFDYRFTLIFLVLLLSSFFIKKRLKFYNR